MFLLNLMCQGSILKWQLTCSTHSEQLFLIKKCTFIYCWCAWLIKSYQKCSVEVIAAKRESH